MRRIQSIFFFLCMVMMTTPVAYAAIIDIPFGVVNVAGENYYLNFTYSDGETYTHTFNNLDPTITFKTQTTAEMARIAITAMYLPYELPNFVTDELPNRITAPAIVYQGFLIPYEADANYFSDEYAIDRNFDNVWENDSFPTEPELGHGINQGRGDTVVVVFAEFSAVPIPSALWLLGSGLIGIVGIRKKFKK